MKLAIPAGNHSATLWRDNQRQAEKLLISDGSMRVTLSSKGITALVIENIATTAPFQSKFTARPAPPQAITHQRIQTSVGEAHAMLISLGPDLTWMYSYLSADRDTIKSAKIHVVLGDREEMLTNDSFPFEFSLPLEAKAAIKTVTFETTTRIGEVRQSAPIRFK